MNNPNGPGAPQGLPPLANLVKPEQVLKLTHWDDQTKSTYAKGITQLYQTIQSRPPESADYQGAYRKLIDVSTNVRNSMRKHQAEQNAVQQNGARPANQGQQDPRPQVPHTNPQSQATENFSQKVISSVQSQKFVVPPNLAAQGEEVSQNWMREAKHKFAQHLQKHETAQLRLQELGQVAEARRRDGKTFSQEEAQTLTARKQLILQTIEEAKTYLTRFKSHQDNLRATSTGNPNVNANGDARLQAQSTDQSAGATNSQAAQKHTELQGQPHTVSSALDAARNQGNSNNRTAMSPQNAGQPGQSVINQAQNPQIQASQVQQPNSQPNLSINTGGPATPQQPNSQQNQNPQSANSQVPHPLSHRAAMAQAAQSYSQPNYQQSTPQSSTHAHPQIGNRDNVGNRDAQTSNSVKMPIPKDLKVSQHVPVSMGPARPTLTGGPSSGAMGPLGQPAIQKHPGFVLEGEGERVLSKKKLEELVRQVTGGSGGESEEGETLSADVEEVRFRSEIFQTRVLYLLGLQTLLQVADDFVDQVIVSACRVAKLRQSSTLELRDIQLILERNYNIRVPGYATDELRTVKKIQPAQGWTQKLSAVQAAKVTGGKTDA